MKKWTVMVIPDKRGATRSLRLYSLQLWCVATLFIALSFTAGFFFRRQQVQARHLRMLQHRTVLLRDELESQDDPEPAATDWMRAEIEKNRAEYEASIEAIAADLTRVYDLENEVREIHGLPPRDTAVSVAVGGGGKGGGPADDWANDPPHTGSDLMEKPAHVIYAVSSPSADLIVQETQLRIESLTRLLADMEAQRERIEHTPCIWPLSHPDRRITSHFGRRPDPFGRSRKWEHHSAIDIGAPSGTPVVATAQGTVTGSSREALYGNLVTIDHGNDIETRYAHLSKRLVNVGDTVERGQIIGTVGRTGRATGPHLHYEVRVNGRPVDPEDRYLGN